MLDQLEQKMFLLQKLIEDLDNPQAKDLYLAVSFKYNDYKKHLRAIQ
jgi:hypothetical protein